MKEKMETTIKYIRVRDMYYGILSVYYPPIMENQLEKQMDNEMETGGIY